MRTDFDPDELGSGAFYKFLTAVVVPRPIAWVATTSADGVDNLAPHSFFTVACVDPPVVQFTSVGRKDSLTNVEATREMTISLTPEWLIDQVNATATNFGADRDEFAEVGLEREPAARVRPPRVAGSPVALECVLHSTLCLGDSTVVFGRVVHAVVSEDALVDGRPDVTRLKPLARLGGHQWSTIGEVLERRRIDVRDWDYPGD
ncbi:flavin reductase family protein [Actinomycetospora termitidis]|uniref:Flavin reductase family protein n=1 Tax=Actinomycetospora termitidis TaxID=3053470 RepID=A0ABT7MAL0_9PSEU|nr:flavin reductase family protein [Actinomycetospora sp. Odt1-22]MDL5157700.1 flavin reductase family protein [Actinomycetospora sp. Odt1-22]